MSKNSCILYCPIAKTFQFPGAIPQLQTTRVSIIIVTMKCHLPIRTEAHNLRAAETDIDVRRAVSILLL